MKIIQISPAYKPAYIYGGPTLSVALLCETLVKSGVTLQVLTTTANGAVDLKYQSGRVMLTDGVNVTYFRRFIRGQIHLSLPLLVQLFFSIEHTSILHVHSWWNATAILSCLIGNIRNAKVILSPRGMVTPYSLRNRHSVLKKCFHSLIGKSILSRCHIHATSDKEKTDILAVVSHANITVIPNFVQYLDRTLKSQDGYTNQTANIKLVFLSRIEEKKGLELLLQSLSQANFSWSLTIAGTGKLEYIEFLKGLSKQYHLEEHVLWSGFVKPEDKFRFLKEHDLLVLFSYNENFANVILESLSVGLPVVISKEVGLSPFVVNNDLGWVADLNVSSIKRALEAAKEDKQKRVRINQTAPGIVKEHFNTNHILQQYLNLYEPEKS